MYLHPTIFVFFPLFRIYLFHVNHVKPYLKLPSSFRLIKCKKGKKTPIFVINDNNNNLLTLTLLVATLGSQRYQTPTCIASRLACGDPW
jgi:hypothetical protein